MDLGIQRLHGGAEDSDSGARWLARDVYARQTVTVRRKWFVLTVIGSIVIEGCSGSGSTTSATKSGVAAKVTSCVVSRGADRPVYDASLNLSNKGDKAVSVSIYLGFKDGAGTWSTASVPGGSSAASGGSSAWMSDFVKSDAEAGSSCMGEIKEFRIGGVSVDSSGLKTNS